MVERAAQANLLTAAAQRVLLARQAAGQVRRPTLPTLPYPNLPGGLARSLR